MKNSFMAALFAMLFFFIAQPHTFADENPQFQTTMQLGISYYQQGADNPAMYEKAIEQFTMARKYSDNPTPIYNIARAYQRLDRCEEALAYFKEYQSVTREIKQYGVNDVSDFISQLTIQCGMTQADIQLSCTPAETLVTVDDAQPVPCYTLTKITTGQRRLVFQLKGFATASRLVHIKADETRYFDVTMDKHGSKIKEVDQQTALAASEHSEIDLMHLEPPRPLGSRGLLWGGVASLAAGTLFTITGGALAGTAFTETKNARDDTYYELNHAKRGAGAALIAIGGTAMITGITLIIIDMIREDKYEMQRSETLSPYIAISGDNAAAGLTWTF